MKLTSTYSIARFRTPLLAALMLTYLGFHVMNGERGIYALFKETHHQGALKEELAEVKAKRQNIEVKVSHMRNDSLDLDLLDEQARRMLGMMGQGEKLILLESN